MINDSTSQIKGWLLRNRKTGKRPSIRITPDALEQGKCYLIQAASGAHIALYQGLDEDLYTFAVQRYSGGMIRWMDARYLESDFCAFMAFDDRLNPLVDFWYKLGASVGQRLPTEWFVMFEEASRLERRPDKEDSADMQQQHRQRKKRRPAFFADRKESIAPHPSLTPTKRPPSMTEALLDKTRVEHNVKQVDEALEAETKAEQQVEEEQEVNNVVAAAAASH